MVAQSWVVQRSVLKKNISGQKGLSACEGRHTALCILTTCSVELIEKQNYNLLFCTCETFVTKYCAWQSARLIVLSLEL